MDAPGPAEPLTLSVADWPVTLWFEPAAAEARARLLERYQAFVVPGPAFAPGVRVRLEPGPEFIPLAPGPWQVRTEADGGRVNFTSFYEAGWMETAAGRGELTLRPQGDPENFLRVWHAWRCVDQGALLLHASGAVRGERGYVFFGPSGSGKTTTARLSLEAGCVVLSDDLVILKKRGGGPGTCAACRFAAKCPKRRAPT